jgi:hypothetical protein
MSRWPVRISQQGGTAPVTPIPLTGRERVYNAEPSGRVNGANRTFALPYFVVGSQAVMMNGLRLRPGAGNDYTVGEQRGVGTGYNLVIFFTAPCAGTCLLADYTPAG